MVGVTYQEIHLFVEFLKEQYGQGRPDYIEALNDLDGLVEVSYREAIERFLEDEVRFDIGYRIVNKYGQALALRNGASIFDLPFLAEKAIEKEFGKNDPDFDIGKHSVEEVAIVNLSKFHSYFEGVE